MRQNTKRIPAKGTARRVVIVRGENDSVFEQIIYIVRDECLTGGGVSAEHVLREAMQTLRQEPVSEEEIPPPLFSKPVFVLVLIAFILTIGILFYFYLHGWTW